MRLHTYYCTRTVHVQYCSVQTDWIAPEIFLSKVHPSLVQVVKREGVELIITTLSSYRNVRLESALKQTPRSQVVNAANDFGSARTRTECNLWSTTWLCEAALLS